jgi:hydroxyacylglutathione hydrolase
VELIEQNSTGKLWWFKNSLVNANTFIFSLNSDPETLFVVDPGSESKETYSNNRLLFDVKFIILLTHGHFDHVIGVNEFNGRSTSVFLHPFEEKHLIRNNFYMKALKLPFEAPDFEWKSTEELKEINSSISVLECPGHTEGSVMYQVGDWLFTGDSVLSKSLIAPTVRGNDSQRQLESVKSIFLEISRQTMILPGHGKPMRLNEMLKVNLELFDLIEKGR